MGEKGRGGSVADAIRRMVAQDKVCFVHFRAPHRPSSPAFSSPHRRDAPLGTGNLSAVDSPHDFREVFIDEGEVNMIETMQVWKEAGYFGAFCHDHTPHFSRDGGGDTGIAFAVGFMRCCIQVAYAEHVRRSADEFTSYHQRL